MGGTILNEQSIPHLFQAGGAGLLDPGPVLIPSAFLSPVHHPLHRGKAGQLEKGRHHLRGSVGGCPDLRICLFFPLSSLSERLIKRRAGPVFSSWKAAFPQYIPF